jgi:hypothetical protein
MPVKPPNAKSAIAIHREIEPLGQGTLMHTDPRSVSLAEVVTSYAAINFLEKAIDARKKVLNPHLMSQAETHGTETEKGHRVMEVGQEKVIRERALSTSPDEDKLKILLSSNNIPILEAFDEVKKVVLNPSKLKYLVEIGKLKAAEVEALREESFRLKVEPGPELKELLVLVCGAPKEEEEPPKKRNRR